MADWGRKSRAPCTNALYPTSEKAKYSNNTLTSRQSIRPTRGTFDRRKDCVLHVEDACHRAGFNQQPWLDSLPPRSPCCCTVGIYLHMTGGNGDLRNTVTAIHSFTVFFFGFSLQSAHVRAHAHTRTQTYAHTHGTHRLAHLRSCLFSDICTRAPHKYTHKQANYLSPPVQKYDSKYWMQKKEWSLSILLLSC